MYRIEYFNDVILPLAQTEDDLSTGRADSGVVSTLGGGVDIYGSSLTVLPKKRVIKHRGLYVRPGYWVGGADNFLVDESDNFLIFNYESNELLNRLSTLTGLLGKQHRLWRMRESDGARQWINARLTDVQAVRNIKNADNVLEVVSIFESAGMAWKQSGEQSVTASLAGSGTVALELTNDGGLPIFDSVLTITANGAITSITLAGMGANWAYSGAMSASQSLVVDMSAPSVKLNGVAAYSDFTLNSGHSIPSWLQVNLGYNLWYITANGACDIRLDYYQQWA